MPRPKLKKPEASDPFIWRVCYALELHPTELAERLGVNYKKEIKPLLNATGGQIGFEYDDLWIKIQELVSEKMGYCMAVRGEIDKALQKERAKRIQRYEQFKRRPKSAS
jgi:hypothetical protein